MEKNKIRILKKRTRSANFSEKNRESLFNIIEPYVNILENKRTDKHTSILKSKTWENIVLQFNLINVPHRTGYQLKAFYEAKKRQFNTNKLNYLKINSNETEIKIENLQPEISSTTVVINDKIRNVINDSNQITISNPVIEIPKICYLNNSPIENSPVLKCVDIKKLKTSENRILSVQPAVVSSTFDTQNQYQSLDINESVSHTNSYNNTNMNNTNTENSGNIGNKKNTTSIQENINKIRIDILNDDRKFRRDEHMKRMEFMELSILIMKSNLQKHYN